MNRIDRSTLSAVLALLVPMPRASDEPEEETRERVLAAVRARPGAAAGDVAAAAGVSYTTAAYHLDRLRGARLVAAVPAGPRVRWFVSGSGFCGNERRHLALAQNEQAMRVLLAIAERPGTCRAAVAERLGVAPSTVNWHLKRLAGEGLVAEARPGRQSSLRVDASRLDATLGSLAPKLDSVDERAAALVRAVLDAAAEAEARTAALAAPNSSSPSP